MENEKYYHINSLLINRNNNYIIKKYSNLNY